MHTEPTDEEGGVAWLFCPADRPDRYDKAFASADVVILDLEDAVASPGKSAARDSLRAADFDDVRVVVRINAHGTDDHEKDVRLVRELGLQRVMLAKAETVTDLELLEGLDVTALIETPRGLVSVNDLATHSGVSRLMWGADDFIAALGGTASRNATGEYKTVVSHLRSSVLVAAKAHGCEALDGVYTSIPDLDGLRAETADAAACGFDGKVAIHPDQVEVIRREFHPSPERLSWADAVLKAAGSGGVALVAGQMVDRPMVLQATRVQRLAQAARSVRRES
nr:CoA ester lyase [Rhodococcus sp. USK13]